VGLRGTDEKWGEHSHGQGKKVEEKLRKVRRRVLKGRQEKYFGLIWAEIERKENFEVGVCGS